MLMRPHKNAINTVSCVYDSRSLLILHHPHHCLSKSDRAAFRQVPLWELSQNSNTCVFGGQSASGLALVREIQAERYVLCLPQPSYCMIALQSNNGIALLPKMLSVHLTRKQFLKQCIAAAMPNVPYYANGLKQGTRKRGNFAGRWIWIHKV